MTIGEVSLEMPLANAIRKFHLGRPLENAIGRSHWKIHCKMKSEYPIGKYH
jgi:hypothetical protein